MRNLLLAHEPAEGVFEFGLLDEKVIFGIDSGSVLGALEVEREPLLNALQSGALREVQKQHQVQDNRRGEDGVAAQEVDFDLHRVAQPAKEVDVVPALL